MTPKQRKPIMLGIFHQIVDEVLGFFPGMAKLRVREAIHFYCSDSQYLQALQRETHRIDLNGEPVEEISEKHRKVAKKRLNPTQKYPKTPKNTEKNNTNR